MSKVTGLKCGHCANSWSISGKVNDEKNRKSPYLKFCGKVITCPRCHRADLISRTNLIPSGVSSSVPQIIPPGGAQAGPQPQELMPPDELEYRTMLQEAILWVARQVMEERSDEIKQRAADRVRTLVELRK